MSRGLEGLYDEYRSGRPRSIADERIAEMINRMLQSKPEGATHWSCRGMAETMGLGYVEGVPYDYVRHGTTTLFVALGIAGGQVLRQNKDCHRHQEFLGFLRHIDKNVPADLEVHIVMDNYSTHKHAKGKGWLARNDHLCCYKR